MGTPQPRQLLAAPVEQWCNRVAAELLVPRKTMLSEFRVDAELRAETQRLARRFKVSTLVVLRRIFDINALSRDAFWAAYDAELDRIRALSARSSGGGNFHLTEGARVNRRFATALVASAFSGQTLYRDAFRMLGFSKVETLRNFGRAMGVTP